LVDSVECMMMHGLAHPKFMIQYKLLNTNFAFVLENIAQWVWNVGTKVPYLHIT